MEWFFGVDRRRNRVRPRPMLYVVVGGLGILLVGILVFVARLGWNLFSLRLERPREVVETPVAPSDVGQPSVPWTVRVVADGPNVYGVVDDPSVSQMVVRHFMEAWDWIFASDVPHNEADLPYYMAPVPEGTTEMALQPDSRYWLGMDGMRDLIERGEAQIHVMSRLEVSGGNWEITVHRFTTDGRGAVVEARYTGEDRRCVVRILNTQTGQVVAEQEQCLSFLAGMVYDPGDGRWKIAVLRVYED